MAKHKAPKSPDFDEVQFQAEQQVRDALMNTPAVKREVRRVAKTIRSQNAETKRRVVKAIAKKR